MEFPETCWTALAQATLRGGPAERAALEKLCRGYWQPVCTVIRARGAPAERVEDLTQDFFLQLMERSSFKKADPGKGRFRTYLLGALRFFLADDVAWHSAQKRGGLQTHFELKDSDAVTTMEETQFDRAWAQALLERALAAVQEEWTDARGPEVWAMLRTFLPGADRAGTYEALSAALRMTEGGAKTEVHRLRQRYRVALRREVGRTVSAPHEIDAELAHLREVLRAGA